MGLGNIRIELTSIPAFGVFENYGWTHEHNAIDTKIIRMNDLQLGFIRISISSTAVELGVRVRDNQGIAYRVLRKLHS